MLLGYIRNPLAVTSNIIATYIQLYLKNYWKKWMIPWKVEQVWTWVEKKKLIALGSFWSCVCSRHDRSKWVHTINDYGYLAYIFTFFFFPRNPQRPMKMMKKLLKLMWWVPLFLSSQHPHFCFCCIILCHLGLCGCWLYFSASVVSRYCRS